jgi:hypothetical protein
LANRVNKSKVYSKKGGIRMKQTKIIIGLLITALLTLALVLPAAAQVDPSIVEADLAPGASMIVTKAVDTPVIPPKPDIYFLADTTGSMGDAIANVKANAGAIMAAVLAAQPDAQFGVGAYQDFPIPYASPFCYENRQSITSDTGAVQTAINGWSLCWGGDGPEGWFYALDRIAVDSIGWRDGSTRIVVIFGDAPSHDPVPTAATGLGYDITEATVTAALQAAGIRVIAVNLLSGDYPAAGMDDDPNLMGGNYAAEYGIIEDGTSGQAGRITSATGGVDLLTPTADQVSDKILEGLQSLPITVGWNVVSCDPGLIVSLTPDTVTVTSGETAYFEETITATGDAPQCHHQYAEVDFFDVETGEVIGTESIDIHILDVTPPVVGYREWVNPHGSKIPPAGWTTEPGTNPNSGMNPDGFYQLGAWDNCDPDPEIYVSDMDLTVVFGPFTHETVIKFTESADAVPESKKIGSTKGQAGAVNYHIILPSDPVIWAVDDYGNVSNVLCLVPPPPK